VGKTSVSTELGRLAANVHASSGPARAHCSFMSQRRMAEAAQSRKRQQTPALNFLFRLAEPAILFPRGTLPSGASGRLCLPPKTEYTGRLCCAARERRWRPIGLRCAIDSGYRFELFETCRANAKRVCYLFRQTKWRATGRTGG
jgi:hypothetical protein